MSEIKKVSIWELLLVAVVFLVCYYVVAIRNLPTYEVVAPSSAMLNQ